MEDVNRLISTYLQKLEAIAPRQKVLRLFAEMDFAEFACVSQQPYAVADYLYKQLKCAQKGWVMLRQIFPDLGPIEEGWTYVFSCGWPIHIDSLTSSFSTDNVQGYDVKERRIYTYSRIYAYEFSPELVPPDLLFASWSKNPVF